MAVNNINRETFEQLIAGEKPVIVDYTATWCGYCRRIAPAYELVAEQYADIIDAVKVDIDEEEALSDEQGIDIIPTLVIYRGGQTLGSVVNPPSKAAIEAFIKETLGL